MMTEYRLGIDWGSTHRRAYLLDAQGNVLDRCADACGVMSASGNFADMLSTLLQRWPGLPADVEVIMAGMIGSRSGWLEVPYLPTPVSLHAVGSQMTTLRHDQARVYIVPGVCDDAGPDIMRGEETQVLGAWHLGGGDGCYLLPGTHSKWVWVENGAIVRLMTFMTGELYAQFQQAGSLSGLLQAGQDDPQAFLAGVDASTSGRPLSRSLFGLRAAVLRGQLPTHAARAWLSGLLIGTEWADPEVQQLAQRGTVRIVGDPILWPLHQQVASRYGVDTCCFDPDAVFVAALSALSQPRKEATP
ncbi:2-dehydro-3-deoxygalactonokinase [Leeia sp.]|uniref:2-dehydro-3-deoxygalactonokinase n=1 Tax=Leeia sp. TaxID=2884678 RepID=UPI0035B099E1